MFIIQMRDHDSGAMWRRIALSLFLYASCTGVPNVALGNEPAAEFLNQLRASGYFELAISYLDRLDQYPGVDADLKSATLLEKAQTYIDAGVASGQQDEQDKFFRQAEEQLTAFLDSGTHPRQSQARLQLGRLQMVRAAQLEAADEDGQKMKEAREA